MISAVKQFKYHLLTFLLLCIAHGMIPLPAADALPSDAQKYVMDYEKDLFKARKELVGNLSKSLAKAMKSSDLDAANAIKAKIEEIEKVNTEKVDLLGAKINNPVLGKWKYYFTPPRFSSLEFAPDGVIIGGNHSEHSWRLQGESLEILTSDGSVGRRFVYQKNSWVASPDANNLKFYNPNSYITKE